jgi:outer membrane protein insertion porin family
MRACGWLQAFVATSSLWVSISTVHAQTQDVSAFVGRTVVAVALVVEGQPDHSQALLSGIDVRKGQPLSGEAWRSSARRLIRLGGFESLEVIGRAVANGVEITFRAVPRHPVTALEFRGASGLPPDELDRHVRALYGGVPAAISPDAVTAQVVALLKGEGFLQASATVEVRRFEQPPRSTLVFDVTAGPRAVLGPVHIENTDRVVLTDDRLVREMGAIEGQPYRPQAIDDALQRLVDDLRRKRRYTAVALPVEAELLPDGRWRVKISIDPGPLVVLEWDAAGDGPPDGDIDTFVPIAQQNSFDDDLLDDSARRIKDALVREGYKDAGVQWTPVRAGNRLELTFRVTRGSRYRVDRVLVPEGLVLSRRQMTDRLGVRSGDAFDRNKVALGLGRIDAEYRQLGHYKVAATATEAPSARASGDREVWVDLVLNVVEGPSGVIDAVRFERSAAQIPEGDLRAVVEGAAGRPYVAALDVTDRIAIETLYQNRGYRFARVEIAPSFSADGRQVTRVIRIEEQRQVIVLDIQILGQDHVSEQAIREELVLREGGPFGEALRLESQRRIYNMGVFRRVNVDHDPDEPFGPASEGVRVIVSVVETPDTSFQYGGGVEAERHQRTVPTGVEDRLEFAPRGFFGIGRRNLGGRNRAIDFMVRASLRPKDAPNDPARDGKGYALNEYRASLTYRERRAFHTDTDVLVGSSSEQAIRTGFSFRRQAGSVEFLRLLDARTTAIARYTIDVTGLYNVRPDVQRLDIDRVFAQVRLSTLSFSVLSDRRNDPLAPSRGYQLIGDTEIALRAIGSEVGFTKTFLEARTYRAIARSPRVVAAVRGQLGAAHGFARTVIDPATGVAVVVSDLPASRRFFAGGSMTVRGFMLDRLGTPDILTNDGLSLGGNGLVVFNAELRTVVFRLFGRNFSTVQFVDGGNVFAKASDISLGALRGSAGLGFRYDSPLGPVRIDFGYKLSRRVVGGLRERGWEYHLSFGEVF